MSTTPTTLKPAPSQGPHPAVMEQAQAAARPGDLQYVPVNMIVPSTTNPRKRRNEQKDADLLESVKAAGVFQSLLLRPVIASPDLVTRWEKRTKLNAKFGPGDNIFEIVAGERRWDAAVKAGRMEVPAVTRKMADVEARQYQIIENLQRDDIDAIDEAVGFRDLAKEGLTAKQISEKVGKVGKSARYVQQSIRRGDVLPALIELYREGRISISHIDLLSPLQPSDQKEALGVGGSKACNTMIFDWTGQARSVRELKERIQQHFHLSLDAAPFRKDDANLVKAAGACTSCQKNTAVNPDLDPEAKHPTCTDRPCYESKLKAHLVQIETAVKQSGGKILRVSGDYSRRPTKNDAFVPANDWKEVKKGSCKSATEALIVYGIETGHKKIVCADKKCKVHHGKGYSGMSEYRRATRPKAVKPSPAELRKQEEAAFKEKTKVVADVAVLAEISKKGKIDRWLLGSIATEVLDYTSFDDLPVDAFFVEHLKLPKSRHGSWNNASTNELTSTIQKVVPRIPESQLVALFTCLLYNQYNRDCMFALDRVADHYKIDHKKIRSQVLAAEMAKVKAAQQAKLKQVQQSAPLGKQLSTSTKASNAGKARSAANKKSAKDVRKKK